MISGKNVKKPTVVKGSVESIQERAGKSVKSARDATSTFVKDGGVKLHSGERSGCSIFLSQRLLQSV